MTIRLLVADGDEVVRAGLRRWLRETNLRVLGEASIGEQTVELAKRLEFDAAIVGIRLAAAEGQSVIALLKSLHPHLLVIALSHVDTPTYMARALAWGASLCLAKSCTRSALIEAARTVAAMDKACLARDIMHANPMRARLNVRDEASLTRPEMEVVRLVAAGKSNAQIGQRLSLAPETVKRHVHSILRKFCVSDRTQAAIWAVRIGLA